MGISNTTANTKESTSVSAPVVLRLPEVAAMLQVSPSTIYRMLKERTIPAFKIQSDWRFVKEDIEKWLQGKERIDAS